MQGQSENADEDCAHLLLRPVMCFGKHPTPHPEVVPPIIDNNTNLCVPSTSREVVFFAFFLLNRRGRDIKSDTTNKLGRGTRSLDSNLREGKKKARLSD